MSNSRFSTNGFMPPNTPTGANSTPSNGLSASAGPPSPPMAYTKRAADVACTAPETHARRAVWRGSPSTGTDRLRDGLVTPTAE